MGQKTMRRMCRWQSRVHSKSATQYGLSADYALSVAGEGGWAMFLTVEKPRADWAAGGMSPPTRRPGPKRTFSSP